MKREHLVAVHGSGMGMTTQKNKTVKHIITLQKTKIPTLFDINYYLFTPVSLR